MNNLNKDDFNSCVARGLFLLNERKIQMEEEGFTFRTCLKAAKWAIEQKILNRDNNETMMKAVIDFVQIVESREEIENGIY